MKRLFDFFWSLIGLLLLFPLLLFIAVMILLSDGFPIIFRQKRVGRNQVEFELLKFRTMKNNAQQAGQLTVGAKDSRITTVGYYLRRFKLDELPQLLNVLKGDMSLVGPRPEVKKYVDYYNKEQLKVLHVRPGITDLASLKYIKENELLGKSDHPEQTYIKEIMPEKLRLNLEYIRDRSLLKDVGIILQTFYQIFK